MSDKFEEWFEKHWTDKQRAYKYSDVKNIGNLCNANGIIIGHKKAVKEVFDVLKKAGKRDALIKLLLHFEDEDYAVLGKVKDE
jgi:hypothetical protein